MAAHDKMGLVVVAIVRVITGTTTTPVCYWLCMIAKLSSSSPILDR